MSKLMNALSNLNETRKSKNNIIVEDTSEDQSQGRVVREQKGVYVLSFLVIVLIAISAVSMSTSIKTFSQVESSWQDSKTIMDKLSAQENDIKELKAIIAENASNELARINALNDQVKELNVVISSKDKQISDMTVAYNDLKTSLKNSVDELKTSDRLMLKKIISLNDQVQQLDDTSSYNLNSY